MNERYAAWAARWRVPAGFLLGLAYLVFSQPVLKLILAGAIVGLLGLVVRAYAAGCLNKNRSLATGGPYSRTRNPLYFGSMIIGAGFAIAGGVWYLGAALIALFIVIYWPVMRREEAFLRGEFGESYAKYAEQVPFFLPALRRANLGGEPFRWSQYVKNHEYEAALGFCGGIIFLVAKMLLR